MNRFWDHNSSQVNLALWQELCVNFPILNSESYLNGLLQGMLTTSHLRTAPFAWHQRTRNQFLPDATEVTIRFRQAKLPLPMCQIGGKYIKEMVPVTGKMMMHNLTWRIATQTSTAKVEMMECFDTLIGAEKLAAVGLRVTNWVWKNRGQMNKRGLGKK
jgi:hypothetical protein